MIDDTVSTADLVHELSPARVGAAFEACVTVWSRCAGGARAGGDWCDVVAISEDIGAVTVGDVSGHGALVAKAMETMRASVPADFPVGIFATYRAADYAVALPANAMLVFYTDGLTEHDRDLIRGEVELAEAARWVFERPDTDAAHAVARQLVGKRPLMDDATTIVLRLPPRSLSTRTRSEL